MAVSQLVGGGETSAIPHARGVVDTLVRLEATSMSRTVRDEIAIAIASASGAHFTDEAGRSYLDLTAGSGVHALGHSHPSIVAAMHDQIARFAHGGWQLSCPARAELSDAIARTLPWPDPVILFCTTGSEAVEGALKVARAATGRRQVLGFLGGYHGKTAGSLGVTAKSVFRDLVTEVPVAGLSLPYPAAREYVTSGSSTSTGHRFGQEILSHPDFGLSAVAGIIVETVQGAGGMQAAAPGFLSELRRYTSEHDLLLIVDEVFTGFGRTGSLYGFETEGIVPDLVVLGKALGGGLPISLVAGPRHLMQELPSLAQTSTFSANPIACAAGSVLLRELRDLDLSGLARDRGAQLVREIGAISVPGVGVRTVGQGLMVGVVIEEAHGRDVGQFTREVVATMRADGVFALRGGSVGNIVKMTPPLNITVDEVEQAGRSLHAAIAAVSRRDA